MIIQSIIEFAVLGLLVFGFINEEKVARFEKKVFLSIKRKLRRNKFTVKKSTTNTIGSESGYLALH